MKPQIKIELVLGYHGQSTTTVYDYPFTTEKNLDELFDRVKEDMRFRLDRFNAGSAKPQEIKEQVPEPKRIGANIGLSKELWSAIKEWALEEDQLMKAVVEQCKASTPGSVAGPQVP